MVGTSRVTLPVLLAFLAPSARADEPPKILLPEQLANQTDEWVGRLVQTTAHCIYTDTHLYRCVIIDREQLQARVEFLDIEPDKIRNYMGHNCAESVQMDKTYCNFSIRFVYVGSEYIDGMSQYSILLIHSKDRHGIILEPDRWYRDEKPIVANCRDPNTYQKPLEERTNCPVLTREQVKELTNSGQGDDLEQIQILDGQGDENLAVPESETEHTEVRTSSGTPNSELRRLWEGSSLPRRTRSARKLERSLTHYKAGQHRDSDSSPESFFTR